MSRPVPASDVCESVPLYARHVGQALCYLAVCTRAKAWALRRGNPDFVWVRILYGTQASPKTQSWQTTT